MKYKQRGYQDDDRRDDGPRERRPERPRRDPELPGGRLAEEHRTLKNLNCHHCGRAQSVELDARGQVMGITSNQTCGGCDSPLHSCRNCKHFATDAAFECRRSVTPGYKKNAANDCVEFEAKLVVEMTRDESRADLSKPTTASSPSNSKSGRQAFEDLFNK